MSDRLLARLAGLNRTAVFLVTLGLMLLGLFLPGAVGGLLLLALAAGLGWLLVRTWPVVPATLRAVRVLLIGLLLLAAIGKLS